MRCFVHLPTHAKVGHGSYDRTGVEDIFEARRQGNRIDNLYRMHAKLMPGTFL